MMLCSFAIGPIKIKKIYPQFLSAKFIRKIYPQNLSAKFIRKIYPQNLSAKSIRKIYPQNLSAKSIRKIYPQNLSAKSIRKIYPQNLSAKFIRNPQSVPAFSTRPFCCGRKAIRLKFVSGSIYKIEPETQANIRQPNISFQTHETLKTCRYYKFLQHNSQRLYVN